MEKKTTTKNGNPYARTARPTVVAFISRCKDVRIYAYAIERSFEDYFKRIGSPYERITTFASDFALAEAYGDNAVKDTYRNALSSWLGNYKYATELTMVLNWYSWFWADNGEPELARLYADLYYKCRNAFYKHYRDSKKDEPEVRERNAEARQYFFDCTD